jgi:hypothetical protein
MCSKCLKKTISIIHKEKSGFAHLILVKCLSCGYETEMKSSQKVKRQYLKVKRGRLPEEVNLLFGSACQASGVGFSTITDFFATFDHAPMNSQTWIAIEAAVANVTNEVWLKKQKENLREEVEEMIRRIVLERDKKGRILLSVSFDGTWSTRGYSAVVGTGTYLGHYSGLPLFTSLRCKVCKVCDALHRKQGSLDQVRSHQCTKNWSQASGNMEADIAVEGALYFAQVSDLRVRIGSLVGDGDAKVDAQFRARLPADLQDIKRYLDKNHLVKNLAKKLYVIGDQWKGIGKLTKSMIQVTFFWDFKKITNIENASF